MRQLPPSSVLRPPAAAATAEREIRTEPPIPVLSISSSVPLPLLQLSVRRQYVGNRCGLPPLGLAQPRARPGKEELPFIPRCSPWRRRRPADLGFLILALFFTLLPLPPPSQRRRWKRGLPERSRRVQKALSESALLSLSLSLSVPYCKGRGEPGRRRDRHYGLKKDLRTPRNKGTFSPPSSFMASIMGNGGNCGQRSAAAAGDTVQVDMQQQQQQQQQSTNAPAATATAAQGAAAALPPAPVPPPPPPTLPSVPPPDYFATYVEEAPPPTYQVAAELPTYEEAERTKGWLGPIFFTKMGCYFVRILHELVKSLGDIRIFLSR